MNKLENFKENTNRRIINIYFNYTIYKTKNNLNTS